MKNLNKFLVAVLLMAAACSTQYANAQAPQKMSYQAVIRNSSSALVKSSAVGMRISVLQGTASGTVVYAETQKPATNINGLVSIEIGSGTVITGTFAGINWGAGPYFIKTETDPAGGTNYSITGTSQLMSVPYALFAANSPAGPMGPQGPAGATGAQGPAGIQGPAGATGATGTTGNQGPAGPQGVPGQGGVTTAGNNITITGSGTIASPYVINATGGGGANFTLPYAGTQTSTSPLFSITNNSSTAIEGQSANGTGISAKSNTGYGVYAISENADGIYGVSNKPVNGVGVKGASNTATGIGVYGSSNGGDGVRGYSTSGKAVFGSALTGTALYGYSYDGYGLEVDGKVKISGANTTPGMGKVLTSDANGNATWEGGVAFAASGTKSDWTLIGSNGKWVQHWAGVEYDLGNNFDLNSNTFTAPVSGIYHFDAQVWVGLQEEDTREFEISLRRTRSGNTVDLKRSFVVGGVINDAYSVGFSTDVKLNAGDKIDLYLTNGYNDQVHIDGRTTGCWFSGRLVVRQ